MARHSAWWNRKSSDRTTQNPHVLFARGEINAKDMSMLSLLLGRFGLESTFMTPDQYERRIKILTTIAIDAEAKNDPENALKLRSITSPDEFLVREHFEDFRDLRRDVLSRNITGRLFHELVDYNGERHSWKRNTEGVLVTRVPQPLDGLIVKKRSELGYEPYAKPLERYGKSQLCADYGVQAHGIIELAGSVEDNVQLTSTQEALILLANQLNYQIGLEQGRSSS